MSSKQSDGASPDTKEKTATSHDAFYLVNLGKLTWLACIGSFILPTLIGNSIGGVSLVAVLNYAQVASEKVRNS